MSCKGFNCAPLDRIVGQPCWHAFTSFGNTPGLALGNKLKRDRPLKRNNHPVYQEYEGQFKLTVWCAWRLDSDDSPLGSWDQPADIAEQAIKQLVGEKVVSYVVLEPAWDLRIRFSNKN